MKHFATSASLLLIGPLGYGQSGLIEGPFTPGSGTYTPSMGGDFEPDNSLSFWGFQGGWAQGDIARSAAAAQRGSRGATMTRVATFTGYAQGQLVGGTVPGAQYVLSGFFKPKTVWENGYIGMDVFSGASEYRAVGISGLTNAHEDKWYFGWTTFTANHPSVVIRVFNSVTNANLVVPGSALTYWDDIAVTPLADFSPPDAVPEPVTLTGLLCGLGALLARQRERKPA